jgi:hypothetical protein
MPQPNGRRSEVEREAHLDRISELNLFGWSQAHIARTMNLSIAQVANDLKEIKRRYALRLAEKRIDAVAELKEQYLQVVREASRAWGRSTQDAIRYVTEQTTYTTVDGPVERETRRTERHGRDGDAAFLHVIKGALDALRELEGLDAPREVRAQVQVLNWDQLAGKGGGGSTDATGKHSSIEDEIRRIATSGNGQANGHKD